jgi:hypothetical protein
MNELLDHFNRSARGNRKGYERRIVFLAQMIDNISFTATLEATAFGRWLAAILSFRLGVLFNGHIGGSCLLYINVHQYQCP